MLPSEVLHFLVFIGANFPFLCAEFTDFCWPGLSYPFAFLGTMDFKPGVWAK